MTGDGKTGLITGGTRGIGLAIAELLARSGYGRLILGYGQDDENARSAALRVGRSGCTVELARRNLADPDEIRALCELVRERTDRLDALVHAAAIGAFKPLLSLKPNQFDLTLNVCARSLVLLVQNLRGLLETARGSVVTLSSLGASRTLPFYGAIGISKAALEAEVRYLAVELAAKGVRVNAVSAGVVQTRAAEFLKAGGIDLEVVKAHTPLGRLAEPDDIAPVVEFLLSPAARWITGQVIVADGGASLR